MQQKYSFATYSENNKARCKKYFLFVKMTMPICVNRKLLRMKSTAIQEINSNFKKNSYIPNNMFRPWLRGSATVPYPWCTRMYFQTSSAFLVRSLSVWEIYLCWQISRSSLQQCFSTFLLQRNLLQMFALLMEPYAMIQVSILLQRHRTVVANLVPGKFSLFRRNP